MVALAKRVSNAPLRTFSIAFDDADFDESPHQRAGRQSARTPTTVEMRCSHDDIARVFPDVVWHAETPLLRTAPAPLFLLSRLVTRERLQGRADRRRRRRDVRRLRHLQGSQDPPLLVEVPRVAASRLAAEAALPVSARPAPPAFGLSAGVLSGRAGGSRSSVLFTPAAVAADVAAEDVPVGRDARLDRRLRRLRGSRGTASGRIRRVGSRSCQSQYLETAHLLPGYILVVAGRSRRDGSRCRKPVSLPRSTGRRFRVGAAADVEDEGAQREIPAETPRARARAHAGVAAIEAAVPGPGRRGTPGKPRRVGTSRTCCRPVSCDTTASSIPVRSRGWCRSFGRAGRSAQRTTWRSSESSRRKS